LRSGHAEGADQAFESGARLNEEDMEIYLPWAGFNNAPRNDPRYIVPEFTTELMMLAAHHHPAWDRLTPAAQKLMARNGCQVLGQDLATPADCIICWTKDGKWVGGTSQALRIAAAYNVPFFNLALPRDLDLLQEFIQLKEKQHA
jgi:hypothetical protein